MIPVTAWKFVIEYFFVPTNDKLGLPSLKRKLDSPCKLVKLFHFNLLLQFIIYCTRNGAITSTCLDRKWFLVESQLQVTRRTTCFKTRQHWKQKRNTRKLCFKSWPNGLNMVWNMKSFLLKSILDTYISGIDALISSWETLVHLKDSIVIVWVYSTSKHKMTLP